MPEGAKILSVDAQENQITIWAGVITENPKIDFTFRVVGTGFPMDWYTSEIDYKFIGSVLTFKGALVWHIYQEL